MNQKIKTTATAPESSTPTFRNFTLRIILLWMFIVFVYWMITKHLPSQIDFTDKTKTQLPEFFMHLEEQRFTTFRMFAEVFFSLSLLVLLFLEKSRIALIVHLASAVLFAVSLSVVTGGTPIPVTAYTLLLFSFFFNTDAGFTNAFDFMLSILVVLIILFASEYFVQWYKYYHGMFYNSMIKPKAASYTSREKILSFVMPWFYCLFLVFLVRLFTTKFNKTLLIICAVLLVLEFYLNNFFDAGLTFMFIPFINWQKLFLRYNKR